MVDWKDKEEAGKKEAESEWKGTVEKHFIKVAHLKEKKELGFEFFESQILLHRRRVFMLRLQSFLTKGYLGKQVLK